MTNTRKKRAAVAAAPPVKHGLVTERGVRLLVVTRADSLKLGFNSAYVTLQLAEAEQLAALLQREIAVLRASATIPLTINEEDLSWLTP